MPLPLDYDALARTPLQREPYDWLMVPRFIRPETFPGIIAGRGYV